jgi:hypothetical protein
MAHHSNTKLWNFLFFTFSAHAIAEHSNERTAVTDKARTDSQSEKSAPVLQQTLVSAQPDLARSHDT